MTFNIPFPNSKPKRVPYVRDRRTYRSQEEIHGFCSCFRISSQSIYLFLSERLFNSDGLVSAIQKGIREQRLLGRPPEQLDEVLLREH